MKIRRARQLLKALADDTRLRIINLLDSGELTVTDICRVLQKKQSNVSKHLTRLRLTGLVIDRRAGNSVYYFLRKPKDQEQGHLVGCVRKGLMVIDILNKDKEAVKKMRRKRPLSGGKNHKKEDKR